MTRHSRILAAAKARSYDIEPFATHAYWHEGALLCGGCDAPILDPKCDHCEIVFSGEIPAEPIPTYGERRQARVDAASAPAEDVVRLILRDMGAAVIL